MREFLQPSGFCTGTSAPPIFLFRLRQQHCSCWVLSPSLTAFVPELPHQLSSFSSLRTYTGSEWIIYPPVPLYQVTLWPEGLPVTVIVRANSLYQRNHSGPFFQFCFCADFKQFCFSGELWLLQDSSMLLCWKISSFSYIKFYCWIHPILGYLLPIFINKSNAITIAYLAAVLCKGLPGWYIL